MESLDIPKTKSRLTTPDYWDVVAPPEFTVDHGPKVQNHLQQFNYVKPPIAQKDRKRVYLIGSLRNAEVQILAMKLRALDVEIFDDWHAAGPEADDYWMHYEKARGRSYKEALSGAAAKNVFEFDKRNLLASDAVILVMPAGKSGHLELGFCCGRGIKTAVFFNETPERYDVMYQFADYIAETEQEIIQWVKEL